MAGELADFGRRLGNVVDAAALRRMTAKGVDAAEKAGVKAASADLGGDRRFSGFPNGGMLSAQGGSSGVVVFSGPWGLAESGRRRTGTIRPRRTQAVMTPRGPRARSSYGRSRGLRTYTDAVRAANREVPQATYKQFQSEVARAMRG